MFFVHQGGKDVFQLQRLSARQSRPHLSLTYKPGELSADNPELCNSILSPTISSSCLICFIFSPFFSADHIAAFSHANHFILRPLLLLPR